MINFAESKFSKKNMLLEILSSWKFIFALVLVITSTLLYLIHYVIFKDLHHILIFLISDIAFIPMEVLLVTLIIHQLLESRDKKEKLSKLNMVIGSFFSEIGNNLISFFSAADPEAEIYHNCMLLNDSWSKDVYILSNSKLSQHNFYVKISGDELNKLKTYLTEKRKFLLGLLQNSNLIEHEAFTDLLWATFHLTEELMYRENLVNLSSEDHQHLEGDIRRAYVELVKE